MLINNGIRTRKWTKCNVKMPQKWFKQYAVHGMFMNIFDYSPLSKLEESFTNRHDQMGSNSRPDERTQPIWSGPFVNDFSSPQLMTFHRVGMNTSHPMETITIPCSGYQSCTVKSSDMYYHTNRHIVVYHRVCYVYHGACNGYHHSLTMMITVTYTMITVT